jgi:hypothetical protein
MVICDAIRLGIPVILKYDGWRIFQPEVHGFSENGTELVSGYQHDGASFSGFPSGPKTFAVAKINRIELWNAPQIVDRRSAGREPPTGMSHVHCRA